MDELEIEAFIKECRDELKLTVDIGKIDELSNLLDSAANRLQSCLDWKREHRRWNNCTPRKKART